MHLQIPSRDQLTPLASSATPSQSCDETCEFSFGLAQRHPLSLATKLYQNSAPESRSADGLRLSLILRLVLCKRSQVPSLVHDLTLVSLIALAELRTKIRVINLEMDFLLDGLIFPFSWYYEILGMHMLY